MFAGPTIKDFFKQFPDDNPCLDSLMQLRTAKRSIVRSAVSTESFTASGAIRHTNAHGAAMRFIRW